MECEVVIKLKLDPENPLAQVRKTVIGDDGKVDRRYGLSRDGEWIEVPEAAMYPEECYLPIVPYPVGKVIEIKEEEGHLDVKAELTAEGVEKLKEIGILPVNCEKCQDRGFTEQEHGLVRVLCDCDKAREVAEIAGIPIIEETVGTNKDYPWEASYEEEEEEVPLKAEIITVDPMATKALTETFESMSTQHSSGEIDDSSGGTGQPDRITRSPGTSKPKQQKKPRAKKKTGKRAG